MEQYIAANTSSPGQYLVVDPSQRTYPVNNNTNSKSVNFPFFVTTAGGGGGGGPPNASIPLNHLPKIPTNSNLNGNNLAINTHQQQQQVQHQDKQQQQHLHHNQINKQQLPGAYAHLSQLNNSYNPNHHSMIDDKAGPMKSIRNLDKEKEIQFLNARFSPSIPYHLNQMDKQSPFKSNNILPPPSSSPFPPNHLPNSSNDSNQNGAHHSFIHQLQLQQQQQQQLLSKSSHSVQLNQPSSAKLAKNFSNSNNSNNNNIQNQQQYNSIHSFSAPHPYTSPAHQNTLDNKTLQPTNVKLIDKSSSISTSIHHPHISSSSPHHHPHQSPQSSIAANLYNINSPIHLNNKRPKLNTDNNKLYNNQLKIDTFNNDFMIRSKEDNTYNPQVEAISPTNLEDKISDDPFLVMKQQLSQTLGKFERSIEHHESEISKKKKKLKELEALTNQSSNQNQTENLDPNDLKQLSITQQIYTDNKRKADESKRKFDKIRPLTIAPLYNQPSDLPFYFENKKKFKWFKPRLVNYFKKRLIDKQKREKYLTTTYEKLMANWVKDVEKNNVNGLKKTKDLKLRDYFEKQFIDLKRSREDKQNKAKAKAEENAQQVQASINGDTIDTIQQQLDIEQENEMKRMRSLAVIPPILLDDKLKKHKFINNNGLIHDPVNEHKELQYLNTWSDAEKEIFKEKYMLSPKNFTLIASCLENKTVADCVQYYYSSKKSENYKQLLRKTAAKKRTRALAKQQAIAEQKAKQESQSNSIVNGINLSTKQQLNSSSSVNSQNDETVASKSTINDKTESTVDQQAQIKEEDEQQQQQSASTMNSLETAGCVDEPIALDTKTTTTNDCKENLDKNIEINNNILRCCMCSQQIENITKSYAITRYNCQLFNISPYDLPPDYRVCLTCKTRYLRGPCSVTTCKFRNSDQILKPLPAEWFELSPEYRYTYSAELNFPVDCKHCCSRCWLLLIRKYGHLLKYNLENYLKCNWQQTEIESFKKLLCQYGRDWSLISSNLKSKTIKQCKDFYFYFKYRYNLNSLVRLANFSSANDSDSDDYFDTDFKDLESDSESLDDLRTARRNSKSRRTNSFLGADGLLCLSKRHSGSNLSLKSDCDSNATLSADENESNDVQIAETINRAPINDNSASSAAAAAAAAFQLLNNNQQHRVPSFLINPNAPTTLTTKQPSVMSTNIQGIPIHDLSVGKALGAHSNLNQLPINQQQQQQVILNQQHHLLNQKQAQKNQSQQQMLQPPPPPSSQIKLPLSMHSQQQQQQQLPPSSLNAKESSNVQTSTCVRDLIYKAIDMTLNTGDRLNNLSTAPTTQLIPNNGSNFKVSNSSSTNHPKIIPPAHSNHLSSSTLKSNPYDPYSMSNFRSPYSPATLHHSPSTKSTNATIDYNQPLNLQTNNNNNDNQPLNLKATSSSSSSTHSTIDNYADEVQDLSKKSSRKETNSSSSIYSSSPMNDYDQPKNLSLKSSSSHSNKATTNTDTYLSPSLQINNQHLLGRVPISMPPPAHVHRLTPQQNLDLVADLSRRERESPHKLKSANAHYQQTQSVNMLGRVPTPNQLNQMNQMRLTPNSQSAAARLTPTNLPPNHHKNSPSPHHSQPQQLIKPLSMNNSNNSNLHPHQFNQSKPPTPINLNSSLNKQQYHQDTRHLFLNPNPQMTGGSIVHGMPATLLPAQTAQNNMNSSQNKSFYHPANSPSPSQSINLSKNDSLLRLPIQSGQQQPSPLNNSANLHHHELAKLNQFAIQQYQQQQQQQHQQQLLNEEKEKLLRASFNQSNINQANAAAAAAAASAQAELNYLNKKQQQQQTTPDNQLMIDFATSKFMRHQQDINLNSSMNSQTAVIPQAILHQHLLNTQYGKPNELYQSFNNATNLTTNSAAAAAAAAAAAKNPRLPLNAQELAKSQQHNLPYLPYSAGQQQSQANIKKGYPPKPNTPAQLPNPAQINQMHPAAQQQLLQHQALLQQHYQHNLQQSQQKQQQQQQIDPPPPQSKNLLPNHLPINTQINQNYNSLQKPPVNSSNERVIDVNYHDAFQTLVNAAAAQEPISQSTRKQPIREQQQITNPSINLAQQQIHKQNNSSHQQQQQQHCQQKQTSSMVKMHQNLFTKENFEKEFRQQEQSTKKKASPKPQPTINLVDHSNVDQQQIQLNEKLNQTKMLENEASKLFSNSFQRDQQGGLNASLIESIIKSKINQESSSSSSQNRSNIQDLNKMIKQEEVIKKFVDDNRKTPIKNQQQPVVPPPPQQQSQQQPVLKSDFNVPLPAFNHSTFANTTGQKINANNTNKKSVIDEATKATIPTSTVDNQTKPTTEPSSLNNNSSNNSKTINPNLISNIKFDYVKNKIFETMKKETSLTNENNIKQQQQQQQALVPSTIATTITATTTTSNNPPQSSTSSEKVIGLSMPLLVTSKKQSVKSKDDVITKSTDTFYNLKNSTQSIDDIKKSIKRPIDSEADSLTSDIRLDKKIKLQDDATAAAAVDLKQQQQQQQSNDENSSASVFKQQSVTSNLDTISIVAAAAAADASVSKESKDDNIGGENKTDDVPKTMDYTLNNEADSYSNPSTPDEMLVIDESLESTNSPPEFQPETPNSKNETTPLTTTTKITTKLDFDSETKTSLSLFSSAAISTTSLELNRKLQDKIDDSSANSNNKKVEDSLCPSSELKENENKLNLTTTKTPTTTSLTQSNDDSVINSDGDGSSKAKEAAIVQEITSNDEKSRPSLSDDKQSSNDVTNLTTNVISTTTATTATSITSSSINNLSSSDDLITTTTTTTATTIPTSPNNNQQTVSSQCVTSSDLKENNDDEKAETK